MKKREKCFDIIDNSRWKIINALKDRQLTITEIRRTTKCTFGNGYYHLKQLVEFGLVEEIKTTKTNVSKFAKRKEKPITQYTLSKRGLEALSYFGD